MRTDCRLSFYTMKVNKYPSAAADSGSIYEPHPVLKFEWDPDLPTKNHSEQTVNKTSAELSALPVNLGPHPADPHSTLMPVSINGVQGNGQPKHGPNTQTQTVAGQEIWVYGGHGGCVCVVPQLYCNA